eukprot:2579492-Karenia_brevis.AAC.1
MLLSLRILCFPPSSFARWPTLSVSPHVIYSVLRHDVVDGPEELCPPLLCRRLFRQYRCEVIDIALGVAMLLS